MRHLCIFWSTVILHENMREQLVPCKISSLRLVHTWA